MNVKRYLVKDMREAMDEIRRELGPDAIVLSSRSIRRKGLLGLFRPKLLEVMAAYDPPTNAPPPGSFAQAMENAKSAMNPIVGQFIAQQAGAKAKAEESNAAVAYAQTGKSVPHGNGEGEKSELGDKLTGLESMIKELAKSVEGIGRSAAELSGESAELYKKLLDAEVNEDIAKELVLNSKSIADKSGAEQKLVLRELIVQTIGEAAPLKVKPFKRSVILMLGPTGVGKTTSLIKLAVFHQVKQELKVGLVNTDTFRVAANEQLKIYSDILGTQMRVVYSPDELPDALTEFEDRDLVFIDTAGKKPSDEKHKKEIGEYIKKGQISEIYLVMSGSTGIKACGSIIENYSFLENYKIIVTKMDEAVTSGILLNVCSVSKRPLAYIATGQNVPSDIEVADPVRIANEILGIATGD